MQARPYDQPVGTLSFTVNQTLTLPGLTDAISALNKERQRLDVKSFCEENPSLWDGIDFEEEETSLANETARVVDSMTWCSYCPVLEQCEDVLLAVLDSDDEPAVTGVIAGVWVDNTVRGGYISHYLENGEWPEGVETA